MIEVSLLKTGLEVSNKAIKAINKLKPIIKNMKSNNSIVDEISAYVIENTCCEDIENINDIVKEKLKEVNKGYEHINTEEFIPNIKDIVKSTVDLVLDNYNIQYEDDMGKEIDQLVNNIVNKVFEGNEKLHEDYNDLVAKENIIINIPKNIMELKENQALNNYVRSSHDRLISINQRLIKGRGELTLDFWDYDDKNFEEKLINSINNENYIMISGPSVEEAQWYVSYILNKNKIGNVHYVTSKTNWEMIQPIEHCDYYNNVIFLQLFSEKVDTIPNSTTIVFSENDSILDNNDTLSFQKRSKNITIEKLKQVLPLKETLTSSGNGYSENDIYSIIEESFNEYDIYMKEVLKAKNNSEILGLNEIDTIIGLIGSFSSNEESRDVIIMKKHFEVLPSDIKSIVTTYKLFDNERSLTVLEHRKVVNEIISRNQLTNSILEKYIEFAVEVGVLYLTKNESYYFDERNNISSNMWEAVRNTVKYIKLYNGYSDIIKRIYEGIIDNLTGSQKVQAQITLFEQILIYDVKFLNKQMAKFTSSDDLSIINKETTRLIGIEYYSDRLLSVLSKMLYSKLYSSNASNYIIECIELLINENQVNKYKDEIKRYYSYVINDYPLEAYVKLENLEKSKYLNEVLNIIINNEYKMSSWWQREIKNEFGYLQINRREQMNNKKRLDYAFKVQELYLKNVEKVDISIFIDEFNLSFFNTDKSLIREYIENNKLSDLQLCRAILKLQDFISIKKSINDLEPQTEIIDNGQQMLELLESKLSNASYKYMNIFDMNEYRRQRMNKKKNNLSTMEDANLEDLKNSLLKLDTNLLKEIVILYIESQEKWINNFDFLLHVMKVSEFTFEEGLDLFIGNNETRLVSYISKHDEFNVDAKQVINLIRNYIKLGKLTSELSYYLQNLNLTSEEIKNEPEKIQYSLLKYKNIYSAEEAEFQEFYQLFKKNKLFNKCLEMLIDYGENFGVKYELNVIKEFKDIVFTEERSELNLTRDDIQNGYNECLKYYESHKTEENHLIMQEISIALSINIEDFSFLANEFIFNVEFFMHILAAAYPKAFGFDYSEELADKQVNYYMLFWNLEMNSVPLDRFSKWCNEALAIEKAPSIHKCLLGVMGDLCGKYFAKNKMILESINDEFVQETKFQRAFVIAYSNSMGVVSGEINGIPGKYLNRKKVLEDLVKNLKERNLYAHIELATQLLQDLESTIKYSEDRRRN